MLTVKIDERSGIALFEPHQALSEEDFKSATDLVDKYIEQHKKLKGLIIHTRTFPGWSSFEALTSHLKFVKDHHKKISFVAISTDSAIGSLAETIGSHFINAEIKHFSFQELDKAKKWIEDQTKSKSA